MLPRLQNQEIWLLHSAIVAAMAVLFKFLSFIIFVLRVHQIIVLIDFRGLMYRLFSTYRILLIAHCYSNLKPTAFVITVSFLKQIIIQTTQTNNISGFIPLCCTTKFH